MFINFALLADSIVYGNGGQSLHFCCSGNIRNSEILKYFFENRYANLIDWERTEDGRMKPRQRRKEERDLDRTITRKERKL